MPIYTNEEFLQLLETEHKIKLNEGQAKAVLRIQGPTLVTAVPGAGKTLSICARLYNMIVNYKIPPRRILALTFSKASAMDMADRYKRLFGDRTPTLPHFSTIHAFSNRVLKETSTSKSMTLIEGTGGLKQRILSQIYEELNEEAVTEDILDTLLSEISYVKNHLMTKTQLESYKSETPNFYTIYEKYREIKHEHEYYDFDDMLTLTYVQLLRNPSMLAYYQQHFDYILVDEAQDTSLAQFEIIRLLASGHKNVCIVGDDDQNIYEWRGASIDDFLNFPKVHSGTEEIYMEVNYRATERLVQVANQFIATNRARFHKQMKSCKETGENPSIVPFPGYKEQLHWLIAQLKKTIEQGNLRDEAILYRNNSSALVLIDYLERNDLPFYVNDVKTSFFRHWVVRDLLSFVRLGLNGRDMEAFKNIYMCTESYIKDETIRGFTNLSGDSDVFDSLIDTKRVDSRQGDRLKIFRRKLEKGMLMAPGPFLGYALRELNYRKRLDFYLNKRGLPEGAFDDFIETLIAFAENCETLVEFLCRVDELEQIIEQSKTNKGQPAVQLITMHSSKGLEWDRVYMIDLNKGTAGEEPREIEAERRLFYVGMTRARKELFLTYWGAEPPQFVKEVGKITGYDLWEVNIPTAHPDQRVIYTKKKVTLSRNSSTQVATGTTVQHKKFGTGVVLDYQDGTAEVEFEEVGKKKFAWDYAVENKIIKTEKDSL